MTAQIRQIPPLGVSNSLKSVCQRQQQTAAAQRPLDGRGRDLTAVGPHHGRDLAVAPRRPVACVLRSQSFDRVDGRRRPWTFDRLVA
jgi:hypothetical protein